MAQTEPKTIQPGPGFLYRVEKGDSLCRISSRFQVPVAALFAANPYMDLYRLQKEDEIRIPLL